MSWLARIFGTCGHVRFTGTTVDGKAFEGHTYIESFGASKSEIEEKLKERWFIEKGIKAKELNIIAFSNDRI